MDRIVVIGGGISGLATARGLTDRLPSTEVLVLEAAPRAGGAIRTFREDGFTWESGPNGFLNRHPSTLSLALRLGLEDELLTGCEQVRRRFILFGGALRRFPDSPSTFLASDLLSVGARLRMLLEPLVRPGPADREESVGEFARRRLGRGAADLLVEPVLSGIYAGDPERISLRAALPPLAALDGGGKSLLAAYLRTRQQRGVGGSSPSTIGRHRLVSFRGGAGRLIEELVTSLGAGVRFDAPVEGVHRDGDSFRVVVGGSDELRVDAVISAAPAPRAARYLAPLGEDLAAACAGIPSVPVAMVALGYREADIPHPLDGFGYLVAGHEGGSVLGVYWSSSVFPGERCPPGRVLLQVILGGARNPRICDGDDDSIIEEATAQLRVSLGVEVAPVLARVHRHPVGIPQYLLGHGDRLATIEEASRRHPGLHVTGNSLRGVGTNACTAEAERLTDAIARRAGAVAAVAEAVTAS